MAKLEEAYRIARAELLRRRNAHGWWTGELSVSPLATATAVVALHLCDRDGHRPFVERGLNFLERTQNADGGWGDTLKSLSNISTTMLAHAAFHATSDRFELPAAICERAEQYIAHKGGVPGLIARYGKDKTFSVPILTCCALAGVADWKQIPRLPFELACLPPQFYKTVRLPVVSYALPALIAIGQVRHHHGKSALNPLHWLRDWSRGPSLRRLEQLQPWNGGFLEATPLTAFVTMSLAGMGLANHPVAKKGVEFLRASIRDDGGWPIDTNLATWVTTLSVNALGDDLDGIDRDAIREWLLEQQNKTIHPYTQADPGGWAWTDLPGGVPDADDTSGALLALRQLGETDSIKVIEAAEKGVRWLLSLQNRDGGWPTFCRGWGKLPFDRSSPDITAHALRAIARWRNDLVGWRTVPKFVQEMDQAGAAGIHYLLKQQRKWGAWTPLWFGNEREFNDENANYGTSRVLLALADQRLLQMLPVTTTARAAFAACGGRLYLADSKIDEGGWGAFQAKLTSTEETALVVETLAASADLQNPVPERDPQFVWPNVPENRDGPMFTVRVSKDDVPPAYERGLAHLVDRVLSGTFTEPAPIGFYFAKLWYFERLYPIIWTVGALRRACEFERRRGVPLP